MKLQEVTDRSWLVEEADGVALLSARNSGGFVLIRDHHAREFADRAALNQHFHQDLLAASKVSQLPTPTVEHTVGGYPVSYHTPLPVEQNHHLPLFAKRAGGGVTFCAGHYAMNTPKGWRLVFCPKLSTLESYDFLGPFRTREQARDSIQEHDRD